MTETEKVAGVKKIGFEGLFDFEQLYFELEKILSELGYIKFEKENVEHVTEKGKVFHILMTPEKMFNRYAKAALNIEISGKNIEKVSVKINEEETNMNKGFVDVHVDGFLITDYKDHWTNSPLYFFLKVLFDRFIYPNEFSKYENIIKKDRDKVVTELKSFLNLGKFK